MNVTVRRAHCGLHMHVTQGQHAESMIMPTLWRENLAAGGGGEEGGGGGEACQVQ